MLYQYSEIYDELLVIKSKQGEKRAFHELVDRWQKRLWQYAFKLTGSDEDAWDAVQETWYEVIKGLTKLQNTTVFPCWAFRILNSKCTDLLRTQQWRFRLNKELAEHEHKQSHELRNNHGLTEFLSLAIEKLSPDRRALLILRYFNNFGTSEIAEILGIPEGTVKSRLNRTVEKLRETMRQK